MRMLLRCCAAGLLAGCLFAPHLSAEEAGTWTASALAEKMAAAVQDGSSTARARFRIEPDGGGPPVVLQVQVKARRSAGVTEVAYEVIWPAERKGEVFVLRQRGTGPVEGRAFTPPDRRVTLGAGQVSGPAFGSDLAYQDTLENFFRWSGQSLGGTEKIRSTECLILESRPGPSESGPYGKVRSWIDPRKLLPLRVEKFDKSGRLVRRIETTQTAKDDLGRNVPAAMRVVRPGREGGTEIEGSNLRHDVTLGDADFAAP